MITLPSKYDFVEMHEELEIALDAVINGTDNLCIIGSAGVGKSLLIKLCSDRQIYNHNTVVVCPTGISAVNASSDGVRATTIHSLFQLPPLSIIPVDKLETKEELLPMFRALHTLIIDEISAVNSDLLSKVIYLLDQYRDNEPVRLILIGDPSQLAPIIASKSEKDYIDDMYGSRFFFHTPKFESINILKLTRIFRQKDTLFSELLTRFRFKVETTEDRSLLNQRVMRVEDFRNNEDFLYIALTNRVVNDINNREMSMNPNKSRTYYGVDSRFGNTLPVPMSLTLKKNAQVMICVNNKKYGYYNGLLGRVVELKDDVIVVKTDIGTFPVERNTWNKYTHKYDKNTKKIEASSTGEYRQFPIRIAFALTAHKTQGLTLDRVYLDLEKGTFASGMLYTAISRVKTLEGLALARPIRVNDNKLSTVVRKFYKKYKIGVQ